MVKEQTHPLHNSVTFYIGLSMLLNLEEKHNGLESRDYASRQVGKTLLIVIPNSHAAESMALT